MNARASIDQLVASALNPDRCAAEGDFAGEYREALVAEVYLERYARVAYPDFSPFVDNHGSIEQ